MKSERFRKAAKREYKKLLGFLQENNLWQSYVKNDKLNVYCRCHVSLYICSDPFFKKMDAFLWWRINFMPVDLCVRIRSSSFLPLCSWQTLSQACSEELFQSQNHVEQLNRFPCELEWDWHTVNIRNVYGFRRVEQDIDKTPPGGWSFILCVEVYLILFWSF